MLRRVAITGFGVVSPIGVGREAFWHSLSRGVSGISRIRSFDADTFDVQLAGEVKEELPLPGDVTKMADNDRKIGFAYTAFVEAIRQAGIESLDGHSLLHIGTSLEVFDLEKVIRNGKADFGR